ncbi:MAG: hypothetical protein HWQ35_04505 [Nostoc sp. NMS1]|uniref:hypothetical protein n=1 Tax=Nostoc sp. NMS1 TaxID=2815388 RepID=UPI0025F53A09|nr:hypothetical protein [Nostoc sp. NMS1]MBN3905858.1 hypothetical protein [Nostoc sp. NMS1]
MQLNRSNFLRFLIQPEPGKPAISNGLRAALALGVPMLIGQLINQREIGLFVGLMAHFVNLANVGGPYQIKAKAMAAATLGIAVSVCVGTLVAKIPALQRFRLLCNTVFFLALSYQSFQIWECTS